MLKLLGPSAAALAFWAAPASSCLIVAPLPGTPIASEVAIAGTVMSATVDPSTGVRRSQLRVDTVLRGHVGDGLTVSSPLLNSCGVSLEVGARYLVFTGAAREAGGVIPLGEYGIGVGSVRRIRPDQRVTAEDLYHPAFGFDRARSDLTPRELLAFDDHPVYWAGSPALAFSGWLRTIRRMSGSVVVTYRDRGAGPLRISTSRACLRAVPPGPPLTNRLTVRGAASGVRGAEPWVFTGTVVVRISGRTPNARLRAARGMFPNSATAVARERPLPGPRDRPVDRVGPCPDD